MEWDSEYCNCDYYFFLAIHPLKGHGLVNYFNNRKELLLKEGGFLKF